MKGIENRFGILDLTGHRKGCVETAVTLCYTYRHQLIHGIAKKSYCEQELYGGIILQTHALTQKTMKKKSTAFLIGACIGAVLFIALYGVSTLNPTYDSWIRCGYVEEDIIQHYAGWQFFRNSDWHFPLTWLDNAAQPVGAAAAWADPLPWAAIFFKILSPILPSTFQYFGIVALLHFMLQGGFACLLLHLFDQRISICLPGTILFCCWPVFIERIFRHAALSAQWILLLMLYLYFEARHKKIRWGMWALVFVLIPGIHAYFTPMAFGLLCASVLEHIVFSHASWKTVPAVGGCLLTSLLTARILGVFMPNLGAADTSYAGGHPFGSFSMNLNAPWNPSSMNLYAEGGKTDWSLFLPILPQNRLQYDGFNYLGLGILFALIGMLVYGIVYVARKGFSNSLHRAGAFLYQHCGLVIACIVFTLFAASNSVYFGTQKLIHIDLPPVIESIVNIFRASGRVFWPVGYLSALCVILFLSHFGTVQLRKKFHVDLGVLLVVAVLVVQLTDLSGVLIEKHKHFSEGPLVDTSEYASEEARQLFAGTDDVICLGTLFDYRLAECMIHANPKIQSNIVFFARGNFNQVFAEYENHHNTLFSGNPIDENTLYVASEESYCDRVFQESDSNIAAWKIGPFYLFGVPTEDRPAPMYTRETYPLS